MGRLFGTDGVRAKAGEYPLDATTVRHLGAALVRALRKGNESVRFLVGRDTRESGEWIEQELARGIRSEGGTLTSAGIIPTPAIAYLTPRMGYTAGLVISARLSSVRACGMNAPDLYECVNPKFASRGRQTNRLSARHKRGLYRPGGEGWGGSWPFQNPSSGVAGRPPTVEAPRLYPTKGSLMRARTIVILILAGLTAVFLLAGLIGFLMAA